MQLRIGLLRLLVLAGLATAVASSPSCWAAEPEPFDWPNWMGPQQNHISTETNLVDTWNPRGGPGSNLLWKSDKLAGISTPVILAGRLYTIVRDQPGTVTEGEKVVCADAASGEILWEHRVNVYLSDVPDTRVGWSSVVADAETGYVYALGVAGYFCCLDGRTGEVVWSRSLHEEYGLLSTYGGRTNIPVLYEDTVLISAVVIGWGDTPQWGLLAKPAHRFLAFDKQDGELRWLAGTRLIPYDTTYSTPTVTVLGEQPALVFGSGDGAVWALQPGTGLPIWNYQFSRRGLNASPLVGPQGRVFVGHSEENVRGNTMGSVVALDGTMTGDLAGKELWRHFEIMAGKSSPLLIDDRVYFVDDRAKLFIYEADTGRLIKRQALGTRMLSTPLYADGKIYLCTSGGRWYVLEPTPAGVKIVHRMRINGADNQGSPVVSRGRIYLPTTDYLYCIGQSGVEPTADPLPAPPSVPPVSADPQPAYVQVVPYEVLLAPGDTQQFRARLYNSRGQLIREATSDEVDFTVAGPGSVAADGTYTAAAGEDHTAALVRCHAGALSGTARVRLVPPLPWTFDFSGADDVPLSWVGGRVRFEVRDVDGEAVMVKRTLIPTRPIQKEVQTPSGTEVRTVMGITKLGTRSQMWMGPVDLAGYTIQADVRLPVGGGDNYEGDSPEYADASPRSPTSVLSTALKQGDIGLINSRYIFALYGASQQARLYSWGTHDKRSQAESPFQIAPGTWYTMKMHVAVLDEAAHVQGKVWPRDQAEPDDWTLEMFDPAPNRQGSPGLFGNAKDAEIYVDNIRVWLDKQPLSERN